MNWARSPVLSALHNLSLTQGYFLHLEFLGSGLPVLQKPSASMGTWESLLFSPDFSKGCVC